jgi:hypothetical protein
MAQPGMRLRGQVPECHGGATVHGCPARSAWVSRAQRPRGSAGIGLPAVRSRPFRDGRDRGFDPAQFPPDPAMGPVPAALDRDIFRDGGRRPRGLQSGRRSRPATLLGPRVARAVSMCAPCLRLSRWLRPQPLAAHTSSGLEHETWFGHPIGRCRGLLPWPLTGPTQGQHPMFGSGERGSVSKPSPWRPTPRPALPRSGRSTRFRA